MSKGKEDDQSMEEILQSIKKIISDDDEPVDEGAADSAEEPGEETPEDNAPAEEGRAEDALELTDVVQDDGSIVDIADADAPKKEPADVPEDIELVAEEMTPEPAIEEPKEMDAVESLLSEDAADAASDALKSLPAKVASSSPKLDPSPTLRDGTTVEDLVLEALRPMLKEWLDANLPKLVEHLVEKEIKKLTD